MAAKFTILTHKIAKQLHLVAESCTVCSSRSNAASPETFGYSLLLLQRYVSRFTVIHVSLAASSTWK
jgi:hypothetical protein